MDKDVPGNGWKEHQQLVLYQISELIEAVGRLEQTVNKNNIKLAKLEIKSGVWGACGSAIILIGWIFINWIKRS